MMIDTAVLYFGAFFISMLAGLIVGAP